MDLSERTDAEIRGQSLTRLVQLALRWIYNDQPVERLRALLRLIEQKFGPPSAATRQRIVTADAGTLLRWSERILSADSLDALLH